MIRISEAYINFKRELDQERLDELARFVYQVTIEESREFFGDLPLEVDVLVEEGSTKVKAVVRTVAVAIIGYGGLRQGVDYIARDSKWVSQNIIERVIEREEIGPDEIIRRHRRVGDIGRLRRVLDMVERGEITAEEGTDRVLHIIGGREGANEPEAEQIAGRVYEELDQAFGSALPLLPQHGAPHMHEIQAAAPGAPQPNTNEVPDPDAPNRTRAVLIHKEWNEDEPTITYLDKDA